ncbi:tyrosine recombinase XerC [Rossellomorea marisflavi]|uniref:tyrosine-type recombinase/integrase n=1 Tax=Rossellomorea marisflavi TaxID=189381 RepID=UPI0025C75349|nr:tyrosine-type recombinase/integrase [Rossellomorea marisflavi]GLI82406.1 tyrosine recombinase XerC [Rossellomorea marisflavi]
MLANEKVTKLHDDGTYDNFLRFIERCSKKSESTGISYKRGITKFFKVVKNKEIEFINKQDLDLSIDDFEDFQMSLKKAGNSGKTINHNVSAIREFIKYLRGKNFINYDIGYLMLIVSEAEVPNHHGVMDIETFDMLVDHLEEMPRVRDREVKIALFKLALETCARLDECLSLTWDKIKDNKNGTATISFKGKGNKYYSRDIPYGIFQELLNIKVPNQNEVFKVSSNSISDLMIRLRNHFNLDENIKFHSIRKAGAMNAYLLTNDIDYVRRLLNHSDVKTTQIYLGVQDHGLVGVYSMRENVTDDLYKFATTDELEKAIEALPKAIQMKINHELNKIMK